MKKRAAAHLYKLFCDHIMIFQNKGLTRRLRHATKHATSGHRVDAVTLVVSFLV